MRRAPSSNSAAVHDPARFSTSQRQPPRATSPEGEGESPQPRKPRSPPGSTGGSHLEPQHHCIPTPISNSNSTSNSIAPPIRLQTQILALQSRRKRSQRPHTATRPTYRPPGLPTSRPPDQPLLGMSLEFKLHPSADASPARGSLRIPPPGLPNGRARVLPSPRQAPVPIPIPSSTVPPLHQPCSRPRRAIPRFAPIRTRFGNESAAACVSSFSFL